VVSDISSKEVLDNLSALPQGWVRTNIGEITSVDSGIGFPEIYQGKKDGDFPFYKVMDISKTVKKGGIYLTKSDNYISLKDFEALKAKLIKKDSLVFAKIGAAIALNRRAILSSDALVDNNIMAVNSDSKNLDGKYLYYFFLTKKLGELSRATTVPSIRKSDVENISMPLPPFKEQHRIVTKIEELLTQLDAGVASLKKVQAQLKRYRQAVLKAAFDGRLTQEWREEHKGEIEPADALVDRINKARKKIAFGKNDETPVDITDLPPLPDNWRWIRLDNITHIKGGITKNSKRIVENGRLVPYLRVANVQNGYLDLNEMKSIEANEAEIRDLSLKFGDILFTEGGDRDKLGRGWIWQDEIPECIYQNHIFRARFYLNEISPKYVSWFGNTHSERYFMKKGKQTTNLASISLTQLRAFPVALPPVEEQQTIVSEIERYFSQIDHLENTITTSLRQAESLRQSILKRAFEGKLVPQNPDDEPASILLERIKAAKTRHTAETKKGKTLQPKSPKRKVTNGN